MRNNYLTFLIVIICIISLIFFSLNQSVLRKLKSSNYDIEYCTYGTYQQDQERSFEESEKAGKRENQIDIKTVGRPRCFQLFKTQVRSMLLI